MTADRVADVVPYGRRALLPGPDPSRFEPVPRLRGFHHWFLHTYTFPSCSPDPDHLTVLTRPGFVEAASRPPLHLQGQAASSFTGLLRQSGGGSLHPTRTNGASRRTATTWNGSQQISACGAWSFLATDLG